MSRPLDSEPKKGHLVITILLIFFLIALCCCAVYLWIRRSSPSFFDKTVINGIPVAGMTPEEACTAVEKAYSSASVRIDENGEEALSGLLTDFGYEIDHEALDALTKRALELQGNDFVRLVLGIFNGNDFDMKIPWVCREEAFREAVTTSALAQTRFPSENARLQFNEAETRYEVIPETYGNEIPDEALQELIRTNLDTFAADDIQGKMLKVDIPSDIYILPAVTAQDPELNNECQVYNQLCRSSVTYLFGSVTELLDWNTTKDWVIVGQGSGTFDMEKLGAYVSGLASVYNTRHRDRVFHTSMGTDISIPSYDNEYGYTIDEEAEREQLMADLCSNEAISREPVYEKINSYDNPFFYRRDGLDDLDGNYVEVSIYDQHLWFYRNGGLLLESDVVTGNPNREAQTKTGAFPLAYKESPSVLVGSNANDGYRTEVKYWMPFYEGQGLHDATWRGAFGGNIYLYDGSHGCVNLPYWAAEMIYENIESGMAIVLY